jgi:predicted SAM-dependent methyltransferase
MNLPSPSSRSERHDYVQYGCGWSAPQTWRNFDSSPTLRFERLPVVGRLYTKNDKRFPENVEYGDIVRGLPVPDASCKAVYCSHVLEHLSLDECRRALRNTYRILQPGGVFRFVLPDLQVYVRRYVEDPSPQAAHSLMKETMLGRERRGRGLRDLVVGWLGNSAHAWMWDYKALEQELATAGFSSIRRAKFGDSEDPKFREVEEQDRWLDALGGECKRTG